MYGHCVNNPECAIMVLYADHIYMSHFSGWESSHGTKELFNLTILALKVRHLDGSAYNLLNWNTCTFAMCKT